MKRNLKLNVYSKPNKKMKKLTFEEVRELYKVEIFGDFEHPRFLKLIKYGYLRMCEDEINHYRDLVATLEQKKVFEKIFGKEHPPKGTWCYVWDEELMGIHLQRSDGKGRFIDEESALGTWDNFQPIKNQDDIPEHLKG